MATFVGKKQKTKMHYHWDGITDTYMYIAQKE